VTPISPIYNFKKLGNQRYHYEKLKVQGYVAMGDSVCSFNPKYGQGMSAAAEACALLDMMLREGLNFLVNF
jgi:hypothetical protein